jgi:uncharacterized lipoprotein NlpE involved in copper resistance
LHKKLVIKKQKIMKIILAIAILAVISTSCNNSSERTTEKTMEGTAPAVTDMHTAQISLDYTGTYKGKIPCADCEGIEMEITLNDDGTFIEKTRYLGKGDEKINEEKGKYTWKPDGSTLVLNGLEPWSYAVGEGSLTRLDAEGNRIAGDLAEQYVLEKVN